MFTDLLLDLQVLGFDLKGLFVVAVLVIATLLMAFEALGPDLAMIGALAVLVVAGIVPAESAVSGFANPATLTIAFLFVVARAIRETGVLHQFSQLVFGRKPHPGPILARLLLPTVTLSAFLNNTPIVAMLTPMVTSYARRVGHAPSRFLMPLAFATVLGGTCTLIGTATNLVVSGLMQDAGLEPMGMFELSWVGVPTAIVGLLYLLTLGRWLLPEPHDPLAESRANAKAWLAEVQLAPDSPLVGRTIEDAGLRHLSGLFLVEIRRDDTIIAPVAPEDRLRGGDHLVFTGRAETIKELTSLPGLSATGTSPDPHSELFEVVLSHQGALTGQTARSFGFRRRYDAAILAVHRAGERVEGKIGDIVLRRGDALLLSASPGFSKAWAESEDFYLVSEIPSESQPRYRKAPYAIAILITMVLLPATTSLTMLHSSMAAFVLLLATGCISPSAVRDAVNARVLVVIGAGFGISQALVASGVANHLAASLANLAIPYGPIALLAAVYTLGCGLSLFISNVASAAIMFPIALAAAQHAHLAPRPFAIALTIAASAAFATPIADQTSLIVYGPGGYRFIDYVRVGLPLTLLCGVVVLTIVPWFWPLVAL